MKAIARYPFVGNAALAQISFPVGAEINVKSSTNRGDGWISGSYAGRKGWLPVSYVELYSRPPLNSIAEQQQQLPPQQQQHHHHHHHHRQLQAENNNARPRNRVVDVPNGVRASVGFEDRSVATTNSNTQPPVANISFDSQHDPDIDDVTVDDINGNGNVFMDKTNDNNRKEPESAFPLMGGYPGSLFEASKAQTYALVEETNPMEDEILEPPVDIYRHAPAKKRWNHQVEYTPEVSVQITPEAKAAPAFSYGTKVAPQQQQQQQQQQSQLSPEEQFWKAHPGRVPGNTSANQAIELERAFDGVNDSGRIEIVATEAKHKKFHMPKGLKKTWNKAKEGVLHHH